MFERVLVSGIVESGVYAIMLDESTDLTAHKHLSICVRYVKDGNPVTKFLKNLPIKDGKAQIIVSEVIACLSSMLGLDTGKMVSLGTESASAMIGHKTGVGVQLKAKCSPFMVQSHCIAHRLNLAVTDSIKKDNTLEKCKLKFDTLYHFMSSSSLQVE